MNYGFWNNKGGTGKTSLAFQAITTYAHQNQNSRILAIDMCPQANLSELMLGGLVGTGSNHLAALQKETPRRTIGGYFQQRMPSPFQVPAIQASSYVTTPNSVNAAVPANIDLVAGDPLLELQSNAMSTLANTQLPGTNTWLAVTNWLNDLLSQINVAYDTVFVDANPSFSIYTQVALAACERLVVPVMADDSSRRAVQNVFSLVHGLNVPQTYQAQAFHNQLTAAGATPPKIHLLIKNRLTQYMGPASAYGAVLNSISTHVDTLLQTHPHVFTFSSRPSGEVDVRDFQTTGVVAFAFGKPFYNLTSGIHMIGTKKVQINQTNLNNCRNAINDVVAKL